MEEIDPVLGRGRKEILACLFRNVKMLSQNRQLDVENLGRPAKGQLQMVLAYAWRSGDDGNFAREVFGKIDRGKTAEDSPEFSGATAILPA